MREGFVFLGVVDSVLEGSNQSGRYTGIVDTHPAPHGRLYHSLVVEGCDNAKVVAAATERPVEIGKLLLGHIDDDTRGCNNLVRGYIVACKTVLISEVTDTSTQGETTNTDVCCLLTISIVSVKNL